MKKILTYTAAAALALSFTTAVPAPAQANEGAKDVVGFCKFINDVSNGEVSVGDCVGGIRGNDGPVNACKFLSDLPIFDAIWKNLGDCVSDLRQIL